MKTRKIVEIGPYPPPNTGWSVRIKHLHDALLADGCDCQVLKLGKTRTIKSPEYMDVQNGFDYVKKLLILKLKGYHFHLHTNANAEKGPLLVFTALCISFFFFDRASLTFHGGLQQIYFPKRNGGKMYWLIFLNFLLAGTIICNDQSIKEAISEYGPFITADNIHPIPAFSVQYMDYQKKSLPEEVERFLEKKEFNIVSYIALREGYFIDVVLGFLESLDDNTGVIFTGIGEVEDNTIAPAYQKLLDLQDNGTICIIKDLDHDQFMTLLSKSDIYLRPYLYDGVSSSVLESLAIGTPVVACDNGTRPEGVITYLPDNVHEMCEKVGSVLSNIQTIKQNIVKPVIEDTVRIELDVLKRRLS